MRQRTLFLATADTPATMATWWTVVYSDLETWPYLSVFWLQQGVCQQVQKATT